MGFKKRNSRKKAENGDFQVVGSLLYESMSKFVKILVFSIFYENHLPDRDLNFFI